MNRDLMEILVCPVCKGDLDLAVTKEDAEMPGTVDVVEGTLTCKACNHAYAIRDGIPDLLPPDFA